MAANKASKNRTIQQHKTGTMVIVSVIIFLTGLCVADTRLGTSIKNFLLPMSAEAKPQSNSNPSGGQVNKGLSYAEQCPYGVVDGPPYLTITTPIDGQTFAPGTTIDVASEISDNRSEASGTYAVTYLNNVWSFWGFKYHLTLPKKPAQTYTIKSTAWKTQGKIEDGCVIDEITVYTSK